MKKASVYVTRMIPQENIDELRKHFDVEINLEDRALTKAELMQKAKGRDAIVSLLTDTIDGELLDAAGPQCKIVANFAVGFNNFDVAAATKRGVILTNTPGVLDDATATHTFALLLATARRLAEADKFVREANGRVGRRCSSWAWMSTEEPWGSPAWEESVRMSPAKPKALT